MKIDFYWGEFLGARKKMVLWLRLYGNDGKPMEFDEIAKTLSVDPVQVQLIHETEKGDAKEF